jgi:hypothetical protein
MDSEIVYIAINYIESDIINLSIIMRSIIYSVLIRLAIGSPLVNDSTDGYPTATTLDSYPVAIPTEVTTSVNCYSFSASINAATAVNGYPASAPTSVTTPVYSQVSGSVNNGETHSKSNHRHKHHHGNNRCQKWNHSHNIHHENNKYPQNSPTTVASYPVETSTGTGDGQSSSGSASTSVYAPTPTSDYNNDSPGSNTDNSSNDDTEDTTNNATVDNTDNTDATTDNITTDNNANDNTVDTTNNTYNATLTVDQPSSSASPLPAFYNQIQPSIFGDV